MKKEELKKEIDNYRSKSLSIYSNYTDINRSYSMKQPLERLTKSVEIFQKYINSYNTEKLNKIWKTFKRIGNLDAIIADAENEIINLRKIS